jgi:hypothetical protein
LKTDMVNNIVSRSEDRSGAGDRRAMTDRHLPEGTHGLHARVMLLSIHTRWVHTCTCREAGSHAKPERADRYAIRHCAPQKPNAR